MEAGVAYEEYVYQNVYQQLKREYETKIKLLEEKDNKCEAFLDSISQKIDALIRDELKNAPEGIKVCNLKKDGHLMTRFDLEKPYYTTNFTGHLWENAVHIAAQLADRVEKDNISEYEFLKLRDEYISQFYRKEKDKWFDKTFGASGKDA